MKKLDRNLNIRSSKNGFAVSVAIALLLASVLLATYFIVIMPAPDKYINISILDSNKKAADFPEVLVANVNSTFSVYVDVDNHLGRSLNNMQVKVKVTNSPNPTFPLDINATQTLTGTVPNGETWRGIATVSLDQKGNYLVIFELWIPNKDTGTLEYSGIFTSLNVQVEPQNSN